MRPRPHRRYPRNVHALVDYDYVERLSQAERDFLDKFTEEFYGASFSQDPLHTSLDARREIGRIKSRRIEDIYERGLRKFGDPPAIAVTSPALGSDPAVDPDYRETLEIFRAALPADARRTVELTPAFLALKAQMAEFAGNTSEGLMASEKVKAEKIEELRRTREVVWNIGMVVEEHPFPGRAALVVPPMMKWLKGTIARLDGKLVALGAKVEGPGRGEPKAKEGPNGSP